MNTNICKNTGDNFLRPGLLPRLMLVVFIAVYTFTFAIAGVNPIRPDRPGFCTGTHTVSPGRVYLETGLGLGWGYNNNYPASLDLPVFNLRFGVLPVTEVNVFWDGMRVERFSEHEASQSQNVTVNALPGLGIKQRILTIDNFGVSLLGFVVASDEAGLDRAEVGLGLLWDVGLHERIELFGTNQLEQENDGNGRAMKLNTGLGLGYELSKLTTGFFEYYQIYLPQAQLLHHGWEAGTAYLLRDGIQLDVFIGLRLESQLYNYAGMGISSRF